MSHDDPKFHLLSGYGRALAAILLFHDKGEDPSQTDMAKSIGMSQQVFANYVKTLTERGYVTRKRRRGRVYYTVVPHVHPDVDKFIRILKWLEDSDVALRAEAHATVSEELPTHPHTG